MVSSPLYHGFSCANYEEGKVGTGRRIGRDGGRAGDRVSKNVQPCARLESSRGDERETNNSRSESLVIASL